MEDILKMQDLCSRGDLEAVKVFAETAEKDDLAVHQAVMKGHLEIVQFLFEKWDGLDVNRHFQWACYSGQLQVAQFLFEKGTNVNDTAGKYTALEGACIGGYIEIIKFLFENGALITDHRAFQAACKYGHFEIVKFLVEKGADVNVGLRNTRFTKHFEIARFLVQKGADRSLLTRKTMRYVSFCEKVENRRRIAAANKIGTWWIPICYDLNRECGKRMMERSWKRVEEMYTERN
jgi:ankyrin repeat protein